MKKKVPRILFVCKYNRFRSVFAEAFFKKFNKNKKIKVRSAGIIQGNPLSPEIIALGKKHNLVLKRGPRGLTSKLIKWQNLTIIVADDVPATIFDKNKEYGKKTIVWKIPDWKKDNLKEANAIADSIEKKVKELIESQSRKV